MGEILKAIARQRENSFFLRKVTFSNFDETQRDSKVSYTIALKFSANQINSIRKKVCPQFGK